MARYQRAQYGSDEWEHISRQAARKIISKFAHFPGIIFARLDRGDIDEFDCVGYGKIRKRPDGRKKENRGKT